MMALPALIDGEGTILFESLAIIEYLDETHPNPPLLPRDAPGRARVRGLAQIVACDSHPLIVPIGKSAMPNKIICMAKRESV
jgi:maleylacetoacetate isomerase